MLDYDVAIIGCGPVGGLAANLLGKAFADPIVAGIEHVLATVGR